MCKVSIDWSPVWISLKTGLAAFIIVFILAILAAWRIFLAKSWRVRSFWDGLFTLPMILPPTVLGFLLLLCFGKQGPVGNFLYDVFGFSFAFSWWGTVLAACVVAFPLLYRSVLAAFDQVDVSQIQAARTLGFSSFQILREVLLPASRSGLVSGSILAMARGLGEFGATAMLAGNIPGKTRTLPLAVYSAVSASNWNLAGVYAGILIVISLIAVWILNFYQARKTSQKHNPGFKR